MKAPQNCKVLFLIIKPTQDIRKKKKLKKLIPLKVSVFTTSKNQRSGFKYFTKDFILWLINNVKNKFTYAVTDVASHL